MAMREKRGKGKMSREEAGRLGGMSQGRETNPANFANDREKAREVGRKCGSRSR